jgi:hypothetical protein
MFGPKDPDAFEDDDNFLDNDLDNDDLGVEDWDWDEEDWEDAQIVDDDGPEAA